MKKTITSSIFFILNIVFMLIVPIVLVWLQYGDNEGGYKLSITAILVIIGIFLVFKKVVLNKRLEALNLKVVSIESNALSITDEKSIKANKTVWRLCRTIQLLIDCIVPIGIAIISVLTIKVVEQGIIKLYGCLMFCFISIAIGLICKIVEIFTTKLKHEA